MRHRKAGSKLNRTSSHRKAMFRNMVTSLFKYDQIRTTDAKAKALRGWADHLVTLAKRGDLHAMRQALSIIREKDVVYKLFEEAPKRFEGVSGGYTRILKLGRRPGDSASISLVELLTPEKPKKKVSKKKGTAPVAEKKAEVTKDVETVETPAEPVDEAVEAPAEVDAGSVDVDETPVETPEEKSDTKET
jgi:large subunit ribosomal protein L17